MTSCTDLLPRGSEEAIRISETGKHEDREMEGNIVAPTSSVMRLTANISECRSSELTYMEPTSRVSWVTLGIRCEMPETGERGMTEFERLVT